MVGFRNFTHDRGEVTDWWSNPDDGNQVAFGRGDAGFVVINRSETPLAQTLATSMAPGAYCDVTSGAAARGGGLFREADRGRRGWLDRASTSRRCRRSRSTSAHARADHSSQSEGGGRCG